MEDDWGMVFSLEETEQLEGETSPDFEDVESDALFFSFDAILLNSRSS